MQSETVLQEESVLPFIDLGCVDVPRQLLHTDRAYLPVGQIDDGRTPVHPERTEGETAEDERTCDHGDEHSHALSSAHEPEHVHYYANIEHDIDTSGVLCLNYPNFEAVCIAAKDCSAPISTTIQGDKGCIKIDGPVSVLSDVQILKNTENSERIDTGNYHRLYSEFKAFTTYIDNLDFEACNKMLEHSHIVMDVLTQARKSANIVFGVEKNN